MKPFQIKVEKPWGYELIFTPPEAPAVGKLLHINSGARISLQIHEIKEETLTLINGKANFIYGTDQNNLSNEEMVQYHGYFVNKGLIHRVEAITDCNILEASTKEEGNTVRLQDDYARKDESGADREQERKKL